MSVVPASHPRAESLRIRELLVDGYSAGLVAREGLLAHGRGEAFDYLLGEQTAGFARRAIRAAAAAMLLAASPVISVNGNTAALCPQEMLRLARASDSMIEVNLFYASEERRRSIARVLKECGSDTVLGLDPASRGSLPGIDSARRVADTGGILAADLVVVPLEDGDRTRALKAAGKTVVAFDLNPFSRTAGDADITIVDNVIRAVGLLADCCRDLSAADRPSLEGILRDYDNGRVLSEAMLHVESNLRERARLA